MPNYILFGPDGSGKSTTAQALKGYTVRSYADPIKTIVHEAVGREPIDRKDKEDNFREMYIATGSKAKEMYGNDFWAKKMDYSGDNIVIDDGRFICELEEAVKHGFIPIFLIPGDDDGLKQYELNDIYFSSYLKPENIMTYYEDIDEFIKTVNDKVTPPKRKFSNTEKLGIVIFVFGIIGLLMTIGTILYGIWQLLMMLIKMI